MTPPNDAVWITGDQETVVDLLEARLAADPDAEYLDVCGTKCSAAEVADVGTRVAGALAAFGVAPGDRVATLIENSAEAMLAWWGIVLGGAVAVPVNTAYKGDYLRHQLDDSGARVLIVEADAGRPGRPGGRPGWRRSSTSWWSARPTCPSPPRSTRGPSCSPRSRSRWPPSAPATWPPSSTPAAPPVRRRAAC